MEPGTERKVKDFMEPLKIWVQFFNMKYKIKDTSKIDRRVASSPLTDIAFYFKA